MIWFWLALICISIGVLNKPWWPKTSFLAGIFVLIAFH